MFKTLHLKCINNVENVKVGKLPCTEMTKLSELRPRLRERSKYLAIEATFNHKKIGKRL